MNEGEPESVGGALARVALGTIFVAGLAAVVPVAWHAIDPLVIPELASYHPFHEPTWQFDVFRDEGFIVSTFLPGRAVWFYVRLTAIAFFPAALVDRIASRGERSRSRDLGAFVVALAATLSTYPLVDRVLNLPADALETVARQWVPSIVDFFVPSNPIFITSRKWPLEIVRSLIVPGLAAWPALVALFLRLRGASLEKQGSACAFVGAAQAFAWYLLTHGSPATRSGVALAALFGCLVPAVWFVADAIVLRVLGAKKPVVS